MTRPVNVHLTGSDGMGWALDQDLDTVWQALRTMSDLVTLVPRRRAQVIHSAWSYPLVLADPADFAGRRVICHMCNDVYRTLSVSADSMHRAADIIGLWISMTRRAHAELQAMGWRSTYIPYTVDTAIFNRQQPESRDVLRQRYGIPPDAYVVMSVMRDTQGADLATPKPQKAPGAWADILGILKQRGRPVHALLAGPRRHWLRAELSRQGIPFTQVGQVTSGDDVGINILKPADVNPLYHAADLCLITSRWEGGPRSILEAAATGTKVLSPPEGLAGDVLEPQSVYQSLDEAVETIDVDILRRALAPTIEKQCQRVLDSFIPEKNVPRFRELYQSIDRVPVSRPRRSTTGWLPPPIRSRWRILRRRHVAARKLVIGLAPERAGGVWPDFLRLLVPEWRRAGHRVAEGAASPDVWIVGQDAVRDMAADSVPRIVCMNDLPGSLPDEGRALVTHVFHSGAVLCRWREFAATGRLRPVIIPRVADPAIFHPPETAISSGAFRLALAGGDPAGDADLARCLVEGGVACELMRLSETLTPAEAAGQLARSHGLLSLDREATVPAWLLEAIACGVPSIYPAGAAHAECVRRGGIGYRTTEELVGAVARLMKNPALFRNAVWFDDLRLVTRLFIDVARDMLL